MGEFEKKNERNMSIFYKKKVNNSRGGRVNYFYSDSTDVKFTN